MDFNFSCTGCGKCCSSAPIFDLSEVLDQAPRFVLAMRFAIFADVNAGDPKQVTQAQKGAEAHYGPLSRAGVISTLRERAAIARTNGFRHPEKVHGTRLFFVPTFSDIAAGSCPALDPHGACSIYEQRPSICRLVPLAANLSLKANAEILPRAVKSGQDALGWECDTGPSAAPLLRSGKFVTGHALLEGQADQSRGADWLPGVKAPAIAKALFARAARAMGGSSLDFALDLARQSHETHTWIDMAPLVITLAEQAGGGRDLASRLLTDQIEALDRRIEMNSTDNTCRTRLARGNETTLETLLRLRRDYAIARDRLHAMG